MFKIKAITVKYSHLKTIKHIQNIIKCQHIVFLFDCMLFFTYVECMRVISLSYVNLLKCWWYYFGSLNRKCFVYHLDLTYRQYCSIYKDISICLLIYTLYEYISIVNNPQLVAIGRPKAKFSLWEKTYFLTKPHFKFSEFNIAFLSGKHTVIAPYMCGCFLKCFGILFNSAWMWFIKQHLFYWKWQWTFWGYIS